MDHDQRVRLAAFRWLQEQVDRNGDVLPWSVLSKGFTFEETRVPLLGPQGIFKPKVMSETALSITTSPNSPYEDQVRDDGLLEYAYRGSNPQHPDNVRLRRAMQLQAPMVYLWGVAKGHYLVSWPVFVVGDFPETLRVTVEVDDARLAERAAQSQGTQSDVRDSGETARRRYITGVFRQRLHQRTFRERVLQAYRGQCAMCRLRHRELLDAAHITPDADAEGVPEVSNGMALCKLHHAAFDRAFVAIRPDYVIEVRMTSLTSLTGPCCSTACRECIGRRSCYLGPPIYARISNDWSGAMNSFR